MKPVALMVALLLCVAIPLVAQPGAKTPSPRLPGLQTGEAPWPREMTHLTERLAAIGLPAMPAEAFVQHIHQSLTISVRGRATIIPAQIGINEVARYISPIHTHDPSGTIHIEAATLETFNLGQFFDVWGVRFTAQCVGAYCSKGTETLRVFSNGTIVKGDPRKLALQDRQQIEIVFGPISRPPLRP